MCGIVGYAGDVQAAPVLLMDRLYGALAVKDMRPQARALSAIRAMTESLRGSYAMGILFGDLPGVIYAVCRSSPLAVGVADGRVRGKNDCVRGEGAQSFKSAGCTHAGSR